jgi:hypothetical protein
VKTEFEPKDIRTTAERIVEVLRYSGPILFRTNRTRVSATVSCQPVHDRRKIVEKTPCAIEPFTSEGKNLAQKQKVISAEEL